MYRSRFVAGTTVLALAAGLAGAPAAQAAPPAAPAVAADSVPVPEASAPDKIAAAAILGIQATENLILLKDSDFVFEMWREAVKRDLPEVRASAQLAFGAEGIQATYFIKNGMREAYERDKKKIQQDQDLATKARDTKQLAASILGVPITNELLVLNEKNFVHTMVLHALAGPKVKAAGTAAFNGSDEDRTRFVESGLRLAHEQDQLDKIKEETQAGSEEQAERIKIAARKRASAVVQGPQNLEFLKLPERTFVLELWGRAKDNSEVKSAAYEAAATEEGGEAARTAFVHTGIHAAQRTDDANLLAQISRDLRRRVLEIQAKAENSKLMLRLAGAARTVLATGSDMDVHRFFYTGRHQYLVQSLESVTDGMTGYFVRKHPDHNSARAWINEGPLEPKTGDGADASWRIWPGLADSDCYSFESVTQPNYYLRVADTHVNVQPTTGTPQFLKEATWCVRPGKSGPDRVSLESKSDPGRFLRHFYHYLYASSDGGPYTHDAPHKFAEDASWNVQGVNPVTTAITLRWQNDEPFRKQYVRPVGPEIVEGSIRHRKFEGGWFYWTRDSGVKAVYGVVGQKYEEVGAHKNPRLGVPITDELPTEPHEPPGTSSGGRYNHFANGGVIYYSARYGAHPIYGRILDEWHRVGAYNSQLKFPVKDEVDTPTGKSQEFQGGWLHWNSTTNAVTLQPRS
ncbi:AbfB domain-containing protein [Kibdelosporangium phytohabitans]|uniref:Alpha-L-arabinofuranosidase B arabinose-binding domain-containing protein n=1 Tax=Kibdelosporangium phytohabitans TaxID=860235 RepID=A0A0N9HNJ8_9PSEU|nr:AbfB domain-containing protein [Kibdelosporangium phytohabitans]ALG08508.1 hypothetical protein AOZ06_17720 [Kibdelosporangium phytohabitans]MBE1470424.1 hypothetical protein [Kibdelosporangium phytohabitans]